MAAGAPGLVTGGASGPRPPFRLLRLAGSFSRTLALARPAPCSFPGRHATPQARSVRGQKTGREWQPHRLDSRNRVRATQEASTAPPAAWRPSSQTDRVKDGAAFPWRSYCEVFVGINSFTFQALSRGFRDGSVSQGGGPCSPRRCLPPSVPFPRSGAAKPFHRLPCLMSPAGFGLGTCT